MQTKIDFSAKAQEEWGKILKETSREIAQLSKERDKELESILKDASLGSNMILDRQQEIHKKYNEMQNKLRESQTSRTAFGILKSEQISELQNNLNATKARQKRVLALLDEFEQSEKNAAELKTFQTKLDSSKASIQQLKINCNFYERNLQELRDHPVRILTEEEYDAERNAGKETEKAQ